MLKNRVTGLIALFCILLFNYSFSQEEFTYDAKGKRDPFMPLVTPDGRFISFDKQKARSDLLVEGIIYDKKGESYAIVNGEVVKAGNDVGDFKVLGIEDNKVTFIKEGKTKEINLTNKEEE